MPSRINVDVVLAGLLGLTTLLVHDVGNIFTRPFATDESWVAISTKLPLSSLLRVSASTPVGWSLLLRLVPFQGTESLRVVPLVFSVLTVVAGYVFVRSLPWNGVLVGRTAASLAAAATLLSPSALRRDDLKQYTADAFVALAVWWMLTRAEKQPDRARLTALGVVVAVGFLFSAAAAFVGAAAFAVLVVSFAARREWSRLIQTAVIGGLCGLTLIGVFLWLYRPGIPPTLNDYWAKYYPPISQGWNADWQFLSERTTQQAGYLGMGPLWLVFLLVAAGVVTLWRLGRPMAALVVPALLIEMVVLGALKQYPLFDLRTSHFLTMILSVCAAVGVIGACAALPRSRPIVTVIGGVAAVALLILNPAVHSAIRGPNFPAEDVRTPTEYVAEHRTPGDLVLVNSSSNWAFGYYWPIGTPGIEPTTDNLQQFVAAFPDQPEIFVATRRDRTGVNDIMNQIGAAVVAGGPNTRVWFIHQHFHGAESRFYAAAATRHHLRSMEVLTESLDLLTPSTD